MGNPFSGEYPSLASISSGAVADPATQNDLIKAEQIGESCLQKFILSRVEKREQDFFSTISANKLKTFISSNKRRKKTPPELQNVKADRSLFIQLLLVAKTRDVDLREVLKYSLSPVPGCLGSTDQQSLSKTTKSQLLKYLEQSIPSSAVDSKPDAAALVIDAMALIQSMPASILPDRFGRGYIPQNRANRYAIQCLQSRRCWRSL